MSTGSRRTSRAARTSIAIAVAGLGRARPRRRRLRRRRWVRRVVVRVRDRAVVRRHGPSVKLASTKLGNVLVDAKGRTLYLFEAEQRTDERVRRCLRERLAAAHDHRRALRRRGRRGVQARDDQALRRRDRGHVQRPPALHVRGRLRPGPDERPGPRRLRRGVVRALRRRQNRQRCQSPTTSTVHVDDGDRALEGGAAVSTRAGNEPMSLSDAMPSMIAPRTPKRRGGPLTLRAVDQPTVPSRVRGRWTRPSRTTCGSTARRSSWCRCPRSPSRARTPGRRRPGGTSSRPSRRAATARRCRR